MNASVHSDNFGSTRQAALVRGRRLEYLTVGWNSLEAIASIVAGLLAGSIALVGFGLDSVIETSSGAALLWRLSHANERNADTRERAERVALRIVGASFLALAAYVGYQAAKDLWTREVPEHSIPGIIIAALSLIAMPLLARAKRKVARTLNSNALHADSRQTDLCAYLSAILLGGLLLNFLLGWWWADPVAGLIMVPIIIREGIEALKGDPCACNASIEVLGTVPPFASEADAKNGAPGCGCKQERHG
ncbi:MAG: cation transporter [Terriglobia bacterium]|jgi:divalent metal cation (Fe/Co/Zn/Cd) transporter|nr:cation transporter [Terriglobia bacterium]